MSQHSSFSSFLTSPPQSWSGLFSLTGLGVAGNILAGLISLVSGTSVWQLSLWLLSILVLLVVAWLINSVKRQAPKVLVPENRRPPKHRGLILLVGIGRPGEDPMSQAVNSAINYHLKGQDQVGLEICWLIATGGEHGSLSIADAIVRQYDGRNITFRVRAVADPFSLQETYDVVQRIYNEEIRSVNLTEADVIADFTGGVKPMSAGMILACGERRPMQYMFGRKPPIASMPIAVEFAAHA